MPLVTGEPQLGGKEAEGVLNDEKGRLLDEICEDDKMDTSSSQFPSASTSKSTEIFAKDSEQLGSYASRNWKRNLDRKRTYRQFLDGSQSVDAESGKLEQTLQQQRVRLVHGIWASIENVCKISSSLLVNKPQCEHIAEHFKVTGGVLKKLGLGKDFVPGKILEGGSGSQINFDFDETPFNHEDEVLEKHPYERPYSQASRIRDWSIKFREYIRDLPAMDGPSEESLSAQSESNEAFQDFNLWGMISEESFDASLDEFLDFLFRVLKYGEDLLLFHVGLEGANNGVAERTGLSGEEFVKIHELLYELLDCYAYLEHCEGSEFASDYLFRVDVCEAESILYYGNLNFLKKDVSLVISEDFLSIEVATKIANLLKRPNHALDHLTIESLPGVKVDQEELRKCRSMIIAALSESMRLTSLIVHALNGKEVHDLCMSLRANRVLENLVISTDGSLADNTAMDLSDMLEKNHSLKSFTLEFDDVSPKGIVYLGAMLAKVSLDKIYLQSWGLSIVDLNFLQENASLIISDDFLSIEVATKIANLLKRPNHALKKLTIESLPGVKVDQEELRKCRSMIIAALSESMRLTSLIVHALNGKEVHDLCMSLRANRVLENLVISTDGSLADNTAMDLSDMLEKNHSLKSFTLEFDDVSPKGIVYLGAMLAKVSLDEIYLKSRGLSIVDLNFLKKNASLIISDDFLSIEVATKIANLLKRPNHALKKLTIESLPGVKVDQEELRKCRSMIIAALSESMRLTSLIVHALNGKEVHDLCMSLRANRVLENLVISTDGSLADNTAMDLSDMLEKNHSLKSFTLEFDDVSPKGIVYLGAMLAKVSLDEIYLKSRGLSIVDLNFLKKNASLIISDDFLSIEVATKIANLLKRPNHALKKLTIESLPGVKVDQEELRKCRSMIIAALSESMRLTSLIVHALNGKEVHDLCMSLRANRVLENLVISTDGSLADNTAMDLSDMLEKNHSLKSFTLEFDDVSLKGIVYLGAMLAKVSLDEIYLKSRGLSIVDLNFLKKNASLIISDDFLSIEVATKIANLLKRPNHALKKLTIESLPGVKVDQEELRKCRSMIIAALSESMRLTSLIVHALNGKEVHDLCMSLRANRVLENLVISTDGSLADNTAMDLSDMLEKNHSLKSFTLEFDDVSPKGIVYLGAMLAKVSLDEIYLKSRGLSIVDLNFLQENASLIISDDFLSIEVATKIANLLKRPNHALKKLTIESLPGVKVDQEELRECRSMIIAALSESMRLTSLIVHALNGKEVHDLCMSLRANRVLENLVISTDGSLADNTAMDLSDMLEKNHSLKSFTLEFDDVSPKGIVYLGAMLAKVSLDEIYLKSRGLSRVSLKDLLGPLMAYIDGKRNVIFSVEDKNSEIVIWRFSCEGGELPMGSSDGARKLLIIKKHINLSIKFADLYPDAVCEILDSLKKIRTLQQLDLGTWPRYGGKDGDYHEVAASLEALLAENSKLKIFRVDFCVHKHLVTHLLRPLMVEKDGQPPVNNSLVQLHIKYEDDSATISDAKSSTDECDEVIKSIAQMIRINKTLVDFSVNTGNAHLRTCDVREILDSLKTNRALEVLCLDSCKVNAEVKVAFIDLLVHYNFTLSTISLGAMMDIETFMQSELSYSTRIALRGLWSTVRTTSDSPTVDNAHDSKQRSEGSTKVVCGSSKRAVDEYKPKKEAKDKRPQLFLSYSNERRDFAMHLCEELKSSNYIVVDQDSSNIAEVVDQCQLAIVVLSDLYVKSETLMCELCTIVKSSKTDNSTLKVYPVFYKLTLQDLQNAYDLVSTFGEEGSSLDIASDTEGLNILCEGKKEISRKANVLVDDLSQGRIDVGQFCEQFSELQRNSWPSSGMEFEKNAICEDENVHTILEEIFYYMPPTEDYNNDKTFGHQGKLEMESKLSIQQLKPLLESLPMKNFYLQRKFNMAQSLQEKYIQYSSFEKMCLHLGLGQKHEYSEGRIAAALFPATFLYHFKVSMFQGPRDGIFRPMLKATAAMVVEKMQKVCEENGVQSSTFFDFVDYGAPLNPSRIFAMCQNFSADGSNQLFLVQDALTGAYYYQYDEASDFDGSIGVIGVQVTSEKIHVDTIHEDGSSYSGVLGDFSYELNFDKNKQCAAKAFRDLPGATFLSDNIGIKCSPLLVIALASAIEKKGLTLTWSNGEGHMEFNSKLAHKVKASACQIQYKGNIKQLGSEVKWGTTNAESASTVEKHIAVLSAIPQRHTPTSFSFEAAGIHVNLGSEIRNPELSRLEDKAVQDLIAAVYPSGIFREIPALETDYRDLVDQLLACQLHEVHDHNYLVVYNVALAQHISVYKAIEHNGNVPKLELTWISDIHIRDGEEKIKEIFTTGLKGREMIVRREGSSFAQIVAPPIPFPTSVHRYLESLLKFRIRFSSNAITSSMISNPPERRGEFESRNEWVNIVGPHAEFGASHNYWWKATSMEAIVYSKTRYTSGTPLKTGIEFSQEGMGDFGYCRIEGDPQGLKHLCGSVVSRGKFSKAPGSLVDNKVLWGGVNRLLNMVS